MEFDTDIYEFVCDSTPNSETKTRPKSDETYFEERTSEIGKPNLCLKISIPYDNHLGIN